MNSENKNKIVMIVCAIFFIGISFCCWVKPADIFSISERRNLHQFPEVSFERVLSGKFMEDFDDYTLDQFPLREKFRNIKAIFASKFMRQSDNNGIYIADGYISKIEYPLKEDAVIRAGERFQSIYDKYLDGKDMKIYVSVVPDKNYFMAEESGHLSMDYSNLIRVFLEEMSFAQYIDIVSLLSLDDYYKTDTHWRQECIKDVAEEMLQTMNVPFSTEYQEKILEQPFYGVYYGQAALPFPEEEIKYLTSETLSECVVYDYENDKTMGIYDLEKGCGKDPYELFLSGSLPLITIENPNVDNEKELLLFRDSFGSSLAPLLVEGYGKITLIDIRYLQSDMLERFIDFQNQDVLFLYSTLVLNNSETLK